MEQELKERIVELEDKVERLEKLENRRKTKKIVSIVLKIVFFIVALVAIYIGYNYVNDTYIKPVKDQIDSINNNYEKIKKYTDKFIP